MKTNRLTYRLMLLAATAAPLAGCARYHEQIGMDENFQSEDDSRSVRRFISAQAASGARADSMLYPAHFDGDQLNSLGQDKLDLIVHAAGHGLPLTIYLNVPNDDRLKSRQAAATVFLKDRGLTDGQMAFEVGPNPYCVSPVGPNLVRLSKTEDASGVGGTGPVDPQNASGPAGATAGAGGK